MTVGSVETTSAGIPATIRRAIAKMVLDLRGSLQDDFTRQLAALGITPKGAGAVAGNRPLADADARTREIAAAVIAREIAGGATPEEAFGRYVRESAYTFLNRFVGLRCLEERHLLIVDGQAETVVTVDPARGASSLYWRVRNERRNVSPRELWRETLRRACDAISAHVRVLFDLESEYAALFPLQETLQTMSDALNAPAIPPATYAEDELLGWVYQYFNADEKDRIFAAARTQKKKIAGDDIIPVTQLYTERYMVDYLLQNTLGALWVRMHPETRLRATWPYYVTPPADDIPAPMPARRLRDITLLDPCCGSGHFLLRAFDLLARMYAEEGIERTSDVPRLILERNLYGLDIDLRAVQIAALALYMKARALAGSDFRPTHLNLVAADVNLPSDDLSSTYLARFRDDPELIELVRGIWAGLQNARELGSLLHPERAIDTIIERRRAKERGMFPDFQRGDAAWNQWKNDLLDGLREEFAEQANSDDLSQRLFGQEAARGVDLIEALSRRYNVVVTNPPYMGTGSMSEAVKKFVEREFKDGKRDLYTAFILRCRDFAVSDGTVGMVTQQSWLFLRSFAALRKSVLNSASITTLAHLGPRAFSEISGEVVNSALFTLQSTRPTVNHRITSFRLVGQPSPTEKDSLLRYSIVTGISDVRTTPRQSDFLAIPETPIAYWLRPHFFDLLQSPRRLRDIADVPQGLATADNERFLRCYWEVPTFGSVSSMGEISGRWFRYAKGGRYQRWAGLEWLVVDWEDDGTRIKAYIIDRYPYLNGKYEWVAKNIDYYFRTGLTYSLVAAGSMAVRILRDSVFDVTSIGLFPRSPNRDYWTAALLTSRVVSYLLRATSPDIKFHAGYVANLPLPTQECEPLSSIAGRCVALKQWLVTQDPLEREFVRVPLEVGSGTSLLARWRRAEDETQAVQATLHALEGWNERLVCDAYELDEGDVQAVLDETGTPAGWFPLLAGYDGLPSLPSTLMDTDILTEARADRGEFADYLRTLPRLTPEPDGLARLKTRLRVRYEAGPGETVTDAVDVTAGDGDGEEVEAVALGARIPIPTETFLEELSQSLELHPLSVYGLLHEMRAEGIVSPPEVKRQMEDWASVTLMRLLGYRWPEEPPAPDGGDGQPIIPLVRCDSTTPTAYELIGARLEAEFGEKGREASEQEFRTYVRRDLKEWLHKDFFKRHVQQLKQRPVVWHFVSGGHAGRAPERAFEAFVRYHALSRETLQTLRTIYAGGLIERLRALAARDGANVSAIQIQIEDVEEFRAAVERIERGDTLKDRIRCRWKGEEEQGRPGPYAPDLDDGVKVNIRPFQEAGLLGMKDVIKKW